MFLILLVHYPANPDDLNLPHHLKAPNVPDSVTVLKFVKNRHYVNSVILALPFTACHSPLFDPCYTGLGNSKYVPALQLNCVAC